MSLETPVTTREKVRVFVTGSCDGLAELREALGRHSEVEIVGWSEGVRDSAATLTGGHLQVVLHGTRSSGLPEDELAAIREHTQAPVILLASGEASALLEQALEADVSDVLLLPQMTENVVFAIRKASHSGRRAAGAGATRRRGRVVTVFSPKGGTGKTVTATNLASTFAKYEGKNTLLLDLDLQFGDAAIMLGLEPEKTIYDLVVAPGELDSEKLAGLHDAPYVGARHPAGAAAPGGRRARHRGQARPPARGRAGVVRRHRRRHLAVLPRADARDARPHRRAPARLWPRRPDPEERPPQPADARAARIPAEPDSRRPEPRELEGRDEAGRGRRRPRGQGSLRAPERRQGPPRRQPGHPARPRRRQGRLLARHA